MRKIISLLVTVIAFTACSSIDCPLSNQVYATYEISKDTLTDTLTVSTARHTEGDTVILNKATNITSFSLPMSYSGDEDLLIFSITSKTNSLVVLDTVSVKKENNPHFEAVDCNPSFFHTIIDVKTTHHAIDSITIVNRKVTYDTTKPNFKVYFKANSN